MPTREELLSELTHKGQVDEGDIGRRVFYTLTNSKSSDGPRTAVSPMPPKEAERRLHLAAKFASCLAELMHKKKLITDAELDDLLLESVQ